MAKAKATKTGPVEKKLISVADLVITAAEKSKDPTLAIPVRSLANVDFNEKLLSAVSVASNGHHYFAENAEGLERIFDDEAASLVQSVASNVTAEVIDLRPNGTLVLQAIKRRCVNGTEEILRLTGEVAPANVTMNKTSSENILNLSVVYEGPASHAGCWRLSVPAPP